MHERVRIAPIIDLSVAMNSLWYNGIMSVLFPLNQLLVALREPLLRCVPMRSVSGAYARIEQF